jgi:histidine triad (HIT) family protein
MTNVNIMKDCIFCKIADHSMPKEFTYESESVMAFPDIHPVRPVHLLIVPKKHIGDFVEVGQDMVLLEIKDVLQKLIKDNNLDTKGYRIGINGGGAQQIDHLHFHLVGPVKRTDEMR